TGTRRPTRLARLYAYEFGIEAARQGLVLVHGGAMGIDTAAAEGYEAARMGPGQIIVLGEGLEHARQRHPLRGLFDHVAVLSACRPDAPPAAPALVARNAFIARLGH